MSLFGNYNKFIGAGNLCSVPIIRETQNSTKVSNVRLAFNDRVKRGDEWVDEPTFLECTFWDKKAEWLEKWGRKGKPILVEGRLKTRSWVDKDDIEHEVTYVLVDAMTFFSSKSDVNDDDGGGYEDEPPPRRRDRGKRGQSASQRNRSGKTHTEEGYATDLADDSDVPF